MLVYDCEIIKAIPNGKERPVDGIEYCKGWRDFEGMGISCICAYDYYTGRYRVFLEDNFQEFRDLIDLHKTVVGFNSIAFDNRLCKANGIEIPSEKNYDILVEIWKSEGLSEEFQYPTHIGYGLDAVCEATIGIKKTGNGALAPILWQKGEYGRVIDYCMNDVHMTKVLLDHIAYNGWINSPKEHDKMIMMRRPFDYK